MMKIESARDGDTATLRFSGQIAEEHLAAIQADQGGTVHSSLMSGLAGLLVDREVVRFLAAREDEGVELRNCPRYIREWIAREQGQ